MFIHLRVHTSYSLLESVIHVDQLPCVCRAFGMPAVGLADTSFLFGALEFSNVLSAQGIQPIVGCTLPILSDASLGSGYIGLLAKNVNGYRNLMYLSSLPAIRTSFYGVRIDDILQHNDGLIFLTGGFEGPFIRGLLERKKDAVVSSIRRIKSVFEDRLYIEIHRHNLPEEINTENELLNIALDEDVPIVAVNEPYFLTREEHEAHDSVLCVAQGVLVRDNKRRFLTKEHYFKSSKEMEELFSDLPEAIENTCEIAKRCNFFPESKRVSTLPRFSPDISKEEEDALIQIKAREGLKEKRDKNILFFEDSSLYEERLEYELSVIVKMNFSGYFLIVADFVSWARKNNIPVGPGRGSGAGSLVAFALGITALDPLRFGLLFERFLNPDRVSMPDFDIDFCPEQRDKVIFYVQKRYGSDKVAHIITFGKLQTRAVLRDVGRVLEIPYGHVDRLCKMIPNNPAHPIDLKTAFLSESKFQEESEKDPRIAKLFEIAGRLEGLYRHVSVHAAGVVIGNENLLNSVPLYKDKESNVISTQFSMRWAEEAGLTKFDFLGLRTLTVLQKTIELVHDYKMRDAHSPAPVNILHSFDSLDLIPIDDKATFDFLTKGYTMGIFQLEGHGVREVLQDMKPDRLEDIIALISLYRPGPMDNIAKYVLCKKGKEKPDYMHPALEKILKETYGVIIYQEQVMQIAQALAGYSLAEADLLRRAMGKKKKDEMDKHKESFIKRSQEKNDISFSTASFIFNSVQKFAGYGFNKSHAAAYALIAYQTAFLKTHYPCAFLAASMDYEVHNTDKLHDFCEESKHLGIDILPPDINSSSVDFTPFFDEKKNTFCLRYALSALKNVGEGVMQIAVRDREEHGLFKDIFDLLRRCPFAFNKRNLESLISAGAFDSFGDSLDDSLGQERAQLFNNIEVLLRFITAEKERQLSGQMSLFSSPDHSISPPLPTLAPCSQWSSIEKLNKEFHSIGFYFSSHPLTVYQKYIDKSPIISYKDFLASQKNRCFLAGVIIAHRIRKSRRGNLFALVRLRDRDNQFDLVIFREMLDRVRHLLSEGALIVAEVFSDKSYAHAVPPSNQYEETLSYNVSDVPDVASGSFLATSSSSDRDEKEEEEETLSSSQQARSSRLRALSLMSLESFFEKQNIRKTYRIFIKNRKDIEDIFAHMRFKGNKNVQLIVNDINIDKELYDVECVLPLECSVDWSSDVLAKLKESILIEEIF